MRRGEDEDDDESYRNNNNTLNRNKNKNNIQEHPMFETCIKKNKQYCKQGQKKNNTHTQISIYIYKETKAESITFLTNRVGI